MSYDVYVYQEGGHGRRALLWEGNYTVNVAPMWTDALESSLGDLIEQTPKAADLAPLLAPGVERMKAEPERYKAMNPENGWGDYEGALRYLSEIADVCANYPQATVEVWR